MAVNTLKFLPGEEFQAVLPDGRECRLNWEDLGRVAVGLGGLGTNNGSVQNGSEIKTVCHNYIYSKWLSYGKHTEKVVLLVVEPLQELRGSKKIFTKFYIAWKWSKMDRKCIKQTSVKFKSENKKFQILT